VHTELWWENLLKNDNMENHNEQGWTFANDFNLQKLSKAIIILDISSEHGHEPLDSIKDKECLGYLRDHKFLKNDSAPWN
jgi:hypothetical protein